MTQFPNLPAALSDALAQKGYAALTPVQEALDQAKTDLGFLRIAPAPWAALPDLSID